MNQEMQYSSNGLALTEQFEGCDLTAYQDALRRRQAETSEFAATASTAANTAS